MPAGTAGLCFFPSFIRVILMIKPVFFFSVFFLSASVQAGNLAGGAWSSARCGVKPLAVTVDQRNPEAYNKSLDKVTAYQKDTNTYLDCLVAEGNLDIQLISKAITDEQLAARAARDKILADVKAANEKFDGK